MEFGSYNGTGDAIRGTQSSDEGGRMLHAAFLASSDLMHQSVQTVTQPTSCEYFPDHTARMHGMRYLPPLSTSAILPTTLNLDKDHRTETYVGSQSQLVFRNVCTTEDPPHSVAISPSKHCVAFGSRTGVELYWIDDATGQPLNRWFRLTKPSDHLYFLPPRRSKDRSGRLRLISTTHSCPPTSQVEASENDDISQTSFWFTLRRSWRQPTVQASSQQVHCADHSYAVPLSDGHHILFTDNETGRLCLGSNMPAGRTQRLSRKFVFEPPGIISHKTEPTSLIVYAAAADLSRGVRVVAGYGDNIVLYSVPADALKYSTAEQEQTLQDSAASFEELETLNILRHPVSNARAIRESASEGQHEQLRKFEELNMLWVHYFAGEGDRKPSSLDELWPLRMSGSHIGSLNELKALSVQDSVIGGLVVWAFGTSGMSKAWRLREGAWLADE